MTEPTRNSDLLRQIADQIEAAPETYKQEVWACGTMYCIGGWAGILSGARPDYDTGGIWWIDAYGKERRIEKLAEELLGLTPEEADLLFSAYWCPKDPEESIPHALRRYAEGEPIDPGAWER